MKQFYTFLLFLTLSVMGLGQTTLPLERTDWDTTPTGWTDNGTGSYTSSFACSNNNAGKLDGTGDFYEVNFDSEASQLIFKLKNASTSGESNTLVQESADGLSWTDLGTYGTCAGCTAVTNCDDITLALSSTSRYLKWTYTKESGNMSIDDVRVSSSTPACSISNIAASAVCNGNNAEVTITFDSANASGSFSYSLDGASALPISSGDVITINGPTNGESHSIVITDTNDATCSGSTNFTVPACNTSLTTCFDLSGGTENFEIVTPITNADSDAWVFDSAADTYSVNGYCGSGCTEAIDTWLIFGPLDMTNTTNLELVLDATEQYSTTDLTIQYTTDYSSLCPSDATWTTAATITDAGNLQTADLSAASGTEVFIGIRYTDDGVDSYSSWVLSNVYLRTTDASCPSLGARPTSVCVQPCNITDAGLSNITCSNVANDETDPFDDAITFQINPVGQGLSDNGYTISSSVVFLSNEGNYGVNQTFVAQPGSAGGGDIEVTLTDKGDSSCSITFTVSDPGLCADQPSTTSNNVVITEVADPSDEYRNRFVEVCNRGTQAVDISSWVLKRYAGVNTTPANISIPSGTILQPGDCFVFLNSQANYGTVSCGNMTSGSITGNGDDTYELVDASDTTIDIYGEVGVDGTGQAWEYEDGIATRMATVTEGQTIWMAAEWEINAGTTSDATPCVDERIYNLTVDACADNMVGVPVSGNEFTYITVDGKIIAAINPNGNDLGNVTGSVYISSTPREDGDGTNYINRTIYLTPTNNLGATVRYYFTQAEFDALVADSVNDTDTGDEVTAMTDLHITKVDGATCSSGFGEGARTLIDKANASEGSDGIGLYLEFSVTGFSAFTAHGGDATVLPVKLVDFTGIQEYDSIVLDWETASESDNDYFAIERSVDGINFETIGQVAGAGNSSNSLFYQFIDEYPAIARNYYRLKQVDFDDTFVYSDVIAVDYTENSMTILYVNNEQINIRTNKLGVHNVSIYNMKGELIEIIEDVFTVNQQTLRYSRPLKTGIYLFVINNDKHSITEKYIIQAN